MRPILIYLQRLSRGIRRTRRGSAEPLGHPHARDGSAARKRYPFDSPGNADYITFLFGPEQTLSQPIALKFVKSVNDIEALTKLNFFPELSAQMEDMIESWVAAQLW